MLCKIRLAPSANLCLEVQTIAPNTAKKDLLWIGLQVPVDTQLVGAFVHPDRLVPATSRQPGPDMTRLSHHDIIPCAMCSVLVTCANQTEPPPRPDSDRFENGQVGPGRHGLCCCVPVICLTSPPLLGSPGCPWATTARHCDHQHPWLARGTILQGTTTRGTRQQTPPTAILRDVLTTKNASKLPHDTTTRVGMGCPRTPLHEPQLTAGGLNLKQH